MYRSDPLWQRKLASSHLKSVQLSIALFLTTACIVGFAQPTAVVKDASAVAVLTRMSAATGWVRATVPDDAVISGTVTRHFGEGDASSLFTVKIRGDHQYRYSEDGSSVTMVSNGAAGVVVGSDGKISRVPAHSALSSRGFMLPMASVVSDWRSPEVEVTRAGLTSVNGEPCVGIQITRHHADSDPFAKVRRLFAPTVIWVSSSSGLPMRIDYFRIAIDNDNATILETVVFSDYRTINGMAVPFHQNILIGDQRIQTFQISSVQFGAGLTDNDFNVSAVAGGAR